MSFHRAAVARVAVEGSLFIWLRYPISHDNLAASNLRFRWHRHSCLCSDDQKREPQPKAAIGSLHPLIRSNRPIRHRNLRLRWHRHSCLCSDDLKREPQPRSRDRLPTPTNSIESPHTPPQSPPPPAHYSTATQHSPPASSPRSPSTAPPTNKA